MILPGQSLRLAAFVFGVCTTPLAIAQGSSPPGELTGRFSVGVRGVDVSGAETKYLEDFNLDDGPRLFDIGFAYAPRDANAKVDRVEFDANRLGGDPFESLHLGVRKYGVFNFQADRRRSDYFYADVIVPPALASVTGSTGGDFHHFDFERVRDTMKLDINVAPATTVNFDIERYSKSGESTTTLDIERDEFELDKPIDEILETVGVGVQHRWDRLTLMFEERVSDYENANSMFLPGFSAGENTTDPASLDFFRLGQPYEYEMHEHVVRLIANPTSRIDITAGWRSGDLDLSLDANETSGGTSFAGAPFTSIVDGRANIGRDSDLLDIDVSFEAADRVRLLFGVRDLGLDQSGQTRFGADLALSAWLIDTQGYEVGVEWQLAPSIVLSGGWSSESRDVETRVDENSALSSHLQTTDRDGFFASVSYRPAGGLMLSASVEDNSIDAPYTLSSPTNGRRYRFSGRYRWENGISLSGSYRRNDLENDTSQWSSDVEQTDLRLGYANSEVQFSLGLSRSDNARDIAQLVTGGTRQDLFAIAYSAETDLIDSSVRWQLSPMIAIGGFWRSYDTDGSLHVSRDDWQSFIEKGFGSGYVLRLSYQDIGFNEDGFDDYDAEIVEAAIGFRW